MQLGQRLRGRAVPRRAPRVRLELQAHAHRLRQAAQHLRQEVCGDGIVTRSETVRRRRRTTAPATASAPTIARPARAAATRSCTPTAARPATTASTSTATRRSDTAPAARAARCPSFCGDSVVDAAFGEQCDDGKNDNSYGGCSDTAASARAAATAMRTAATRSATTATASTATAATSRARPNAT